MTTKRFRELILERATQLPWLPRYRVVVHADGSVEWEGISAVVEVGPREWSVSPQQIDQLHAALEQARFAQFEYSDSHFGDETPLPTITVIHADGEVLRANNARPWIMTPAFEEAEKRFDALANAIGQIVGTAPYVRGQRADDGRRMSFFTLTLERGPCFGDCPIYAVNVSNDGRVDWLGEMFVDAKGERSWTVSTDVVEKVRQSLVRAKFTQLRDRYDRDGVTDQPSATITVQFLNGTTKRVYHYHGHYYNRSPEEDRVVNELLWLENRIDRLLGTRESIGRRGF